MLKKSMPSGAMLILLLTGLLAPSVGSGSSQIGQVARLQAGPVTFEADVPVRGSYLFSDDSVVWWDDNGDGVKEQHRLEAPLIVDLAAAGFKPGDLILISSRGVLQFAADWDPNWVWSGHPDLWGVFSSSNTLLWDRSQYGEVGPLHRVPGAIDVGRPYDTGPTYNGFPRDIPEDFRIDGWGTSIRIPPGARYLMLSSHDSGYCNNGGWLKVAIEKDTDEDGLWDSWETNGIDADRDGTIDLVLEGADWKHKDIYVEVDFMEGHIPDVGALNDVEDAFRQAPVENPDGDWGIELHVEVDSADTMPHQDVLYDWSDFYSIKDAHFGTPTQRSDPNQGKILDAKWAVYHYCLFAHQFAEWDASLMPPNWTVTTAAGSGEYYGNDFLVSLGAWTDGVGSRDDQAAVLMHELGHNLGLDHGGGDGINYKPNYLSVMNSLFEMPDINPFRLLDYSRSRLPDLDERNLNETRGVTDNLSCVSDWLYTAYGRPPYTSAQLPLASLPIDWNGNGPIDNETVVANPNNFPSWGHTSPSNETLHGFNDWRNLVLNFRETRGYSDDAEPSLEDLEITWETVQAMREEAKQRHEVGATNLSAPSGVVDQTGVTVNLTLVNMGGNTENVNVTVYANTTVIASGILALPRTSTTAISLPCITTGLRIGNYTLTAYINPVANETYTADNTFIGRIITVVDKTPPTASINSPTSGSRVKSSTITVVWTGSDINSAVAVYEVRLDGGAWTTVGTDTSHKFTGMSDGSHTVDVRATDMGGNTKMATVNFTVDATPPSTIVRPASSEDWYTVPTRIELDAADPRPGTGVKYTFYRIDDGPVSNATGWPFSFDAPEGSHVCMFWSEDEVGNLEIAQTAVIKVDTLPPTTAISPPPNPGNDTYPPPLTVQLFAEDPEPGSGISKTFYSIDSQDALEYRPDGFLALEGDHLYTYWSLDNAGNSELKRQALIRVEITESLLAIFAGLVLVHQLLSSRRQRRGFAH